MKYSPLFILLPLLLLAGCGGDDPATPEGPTTGTVIIDPAPDDLDAGWVLKLVAGDGANDHSGSGNATIGDLPPGSLTVDWDRIPGWTSTVGFEDAVLAAGDTLVLDVTYTLDAPRALEFVDVAAGAFMIGAPDTEPGSEDDERPRHTVILTHDLSVGVTEVTLAQWEDVMDEGATIAATEANLPKTSISWYDAVDFCNALSAAEGLTAAYTVDGTDVSWDPDAPGYRLPTEAEWEYVCRAGTTTALSAGELQELECDADPVLAYYGWTCANAGGAARHVGYHAANPWGLYDVHGNVDEWCWDVYEDDYYGVATVTDPAGPASGTYRVARGGNYLAYGSNARSASRTGYRTITLNPAVGLRVVRSAVIGKAAGR